MHPNESGAKSVQHYIVDDLAGGYEVSTHDVTDAHVDMTEEELELRQEQLDEMIAYANYLVEMFSWEKGVISASIQLGNCKEE